MLTDWLQPLGVPFPAGGRSNSRALGLALPSVPRGLYPTGCAAHPGVRHGLWHVRTGSLSPAGGQWWDPGWGAVWQRETPWQRVASGLPCWDPPGPGAGLWVERVPPAPCPARAGQEPAQLAPAQQIILKALAGTSTSQNSHVSMAGEGAASPAPGAALQPLPRRGRQGQPVARAGGGAWGGQDPDTAGCSVLHTGMVSTAWPHDT